MAFDDFEPSSPIENEDDLLDLAREESRSKTAAGRAKKGDFDEDEDLFGFPVMDGSTPAQSGSSTVTSSMGALEEDIERITEQVNDLIDDDDLFEDDSIDDLEPLDEAPAPPAPKAAAKRAPQPVPVPSEELDDLLEATTARRKNKPKPAPAKERGEAHAPAQAQPAAPVAQASGIQLGRGAAILIGAAACFAFALLAVVWVTGRGVQDALATRSVDPSPVVQDGLQGRIAQLEAQLEQQRAEFTAALAAEDSAETDPGITVVRVEPEWFIERKLIQEAMSEGRYREARKRLFALQAVMDDLDTEVREHLAPTVAFLIPETYRLQAEAQGDEQ